MIREEFKLIAWVDSTKENQLESQKGSDNYKIAYTAEDGNSECSAKIADNCL